MTDQLNTQLTPKKERAMPTVIKDKQNPGTLPAANYVRDRDNEKMQGVFRNYETPGGVLEFIYRAYKGDKVEKYSFRDGEIYTIPRGVVRHLNKNCWYPEYEHYNNEPGSFGKGVDPYNPNSSMRISRKIKRFGFESLEFASLEDIPQTSPIVAVEYI